MRAAVLTRFGGPEAVELRTVPDPQPGPGEVRVRVAAAATNNTDLRTREGPTGCRESATPSPGGWGRSTSRGSRGPTSRAPWTRSGPSSMPTSSDAECSPTRRRSTGRVSRTGSSPDWRECSPSESDGGFADYVVLPVAAVHDMSGSPLDDAQLACLPIAYGTAMGMLERGAVRAGETVLVTGASGGVGLAVVQLASARGCRVIAQTSSGKSDLVRDSGADEVADRSAEGVADLAPEGLDAVVVVVGGPSSIGCSRAGGRWVVAGAVGGAVVSLDLRRLYLHNLRLVGSTMHAPAHFVALAELARSGAVRPRIAATYPLEQIHAAHAELAERSHVGKIVVLPS